MKKLYLICDGYADEVLPTFLKDWGGEKVTVVPLRADLEGFQCPELAPETPVVFAPGKPDAVSTPELLNAVMQHTIGGGSLLMLAGGMTSLCTHEWALLASARILRRQPYGEISVEKTESPLTEDFGAAQLWDEALFFERSVFDDSEMLVSMTLGTQSYPMIWTRRWYLGRVYCVGSLLGRSALDAYAPVVRSILNAMAGEG